MNPNVHSSGNIGFSHLHSTEGVEQETDRLVKKQEKQKEGTTETKKSKL